MLLDGNINQKPIKPRVRKSASFNFCRNLKKTRAKLRNLQKNSLTLLHQIINANDKDLILLKQKLHDTNELKNDINAQNLIFLIYQLNGAIPKSYFDINDPDNDTLYITIKIFKILNNYKLFFFFFSHYNIDEKVILKLIPLLRYKFYAKNEYIFKEGDNSTKMYFILHGNISFRKKVNSLEFETAQDVEQYKKGDGQYFGEWDLIYGRKTKLSALCLDNCHIIYIGKETFQRYIQEKFTKTENDLKNNLINILNKYIFIPEFKLERFISSEVKMLFFKKNEIIFKEGDENRYLYLIYSGEANLLINMSQGEKHSLFNSFDEIKIEKIQKKAQKLNYKDILKKPLLKNNNQNLFQTDIIFNRNDYKPVATLGSGSFAGLEIVTGITNFKYTLISNSNFTSVYRIYLKYLDEHLKEFMLNLIPLFLELEEKIHNQIDKIKYIDFNILPYYCQKYNNLHKYNKYIEYIDTNENDDTFIKFIKKIENKFDINEGGFIKMNKYNLNLQKERNILKNQLKENQLKDQKIDIFVKKYEKEQKAKLKYKKVRLIHSAKNCKKKTIKLNKNNSFLICDSKNRPVSSIGTKNKNTSMIIKDGKDNSSYNISKSNLKSANNSQLMNKKKYYNLFNKEEINELQNEIKKKKEKHISLFKMPKKRITVYKIKQSLSIDSKELVKEVLIKNSNNKFININRNNNNMHNYKIESSIFRDHNNKNKSNYMTININKNNVENNKNNFINSRENMNIKQNHNLHDIKNQKKYHFYDTGLFDMPLVVQLGQN